MPAEFWMALAALVVSTVSLGWNAYTWLRAERSDVRVKARHDGVVVASGSYVLTVVVTNHGSKAERVERVGLWFDDATKIFPPDMDVSGQGVQAAVDERIEPRSNYRWEYDFGTVRFRHGLGYRPWAMLATGETIEGVAGVVSARGLITAGLGHLSVPLPGDGDGDDGGQTASADSGSGPA
jgi:hypothetical protein